MPSCIVPPFPRSQSYAKYGRTIDVNGATTIAGAVRRRAAPALVILALLGFIGLGLPEGALGVVWPSMRGTFGRPVSALGVLLAAFTTGYLVASVATGRLTRALGTGRLLAAGATVSATGFAAYALSPVWAGVIAGSALVGTASGVIDAGLNAYVAEHLGVRALNGLHACFGIGATLGPLLVTGLLHADASWRVAYVLLCAFEAGLAIAFFATRGVWSTSPPPPAAVPGRPTGLVVLGVLVFFVYVGIEASAGQWSYSLFTEERGMSTAAAGIWVGVYWGCLTAGRLLAGLVAHRVGSHAVLNTSMTGTVLGTALLWWSPAPVVGALGLALTGLSLAAIFPTLIAITPDRLGVERARSAIGYQVAAAALGGALLPSIAGVLAARWSLEVVGPLLVVATGVMIVLHAAAHRMAARLSAPPAL
jgi:fucose permease